jgi:hypothetical protein
LITERFAKLGDLNSLLASIYLIATVAALLSSIILMGRLNVALKEARYLPGNHSDLTSRTKLALPLALLFGGLVIYWALFLGKGWAGANGGFLADLAPFFRDILFAVQITCTFLLFVVSSQYLSWYTLRFKLIQQSPASPKKSVDKPAEAKAGESEIKLDVSLARKLQEFIGQLSPGKIPAFLICFFAIALLIEAAYLFGDRPLWETAADILLALVVLGGLAGIIILAVSVGAAAHSGVRKYLGFGILGVIHAVLQLGTPIVLLYYGDWRLLIVVWLLTVVTNGLGLIQAAVDFVLGKPDDKDGKFIQWIRSFLTFRAAAWLMQREQPFFFLSIWLLYGAIVLSSPFVLARFMKPRTVCELISNWATSEFGLLPAIGLEQACCCLLPFMWVTV